MRVRELRRLLDKADDTLEVVFAADSIMGGKYQTSVGYGHIATSDYGKKRPVFLLATEKP